MDSSDPVNCLNNQYYEQLECVLQQHQQSAAIVQTTKIQRCVGITFVQIISTVMQIKPKLKELQTAAAPSIYCLETTAYPYLH